MKIDKEYFKDLSSYSEFKLKVSMLGKKISDEDVLKCLPKVDNNYRYIIENGIPVWINDRGEKEDNPIIENSTWWYTFYSCKKLISIIIPNSVKSIGDYCFCGCNNLTSIKLSNNVRSIDICAFWGCESLTLIIIPNSVKSINKFAFIECDNLKTVYLPKHLKNFKDHFPSHTKIIYT